MPTRSVTLQTEGKPTFRACEDVVNFALPGGLVRHIFKFGSGINRFLRWVTIKRLEGACIGGQLGAGVDTKVFIEIAAHDR